MLQKEKHAKIYWDEKTKTKQSLSQTKRLEEINQKIRGAFNKFPDFFVQAFKIVVNS